MNRTEYADGFLEAVQVETLSVLIVDDEVEFMETLVKRLRKRKLAVNGVTSGEAALAQLKETPVDIVVLDVKMPGMSGLDALREIKRRYSLLEVIMLTGHANMEVAIEGMDLGAFDYLMKPIEIDELVYKIQDACKRKRLNEKAGDSQKREARPVDRPYVFNQKNAFKNLEWGKERRRSSRWTPKLFAPPSRPGTIISSCS